MFLLERQVSLNDYLKSVLMVECVHSSVPLLSFLGGKKTPVTSTYHLLVTCNSSYVSLMWTLLLALSTTSVDHEALTFQRRDVLHLRVLSYYVAPGDLILFRSCGPVSGIQRSVRCYISLQW